MPASADTVIPAVPSCDTPVVFLHGWGGSAAGTWLASKLPERLHDRGRVCVVVDLPGHGARTRQAGAPSEPSDYDAIVEMVDRGLPPEAALDIVGFSLGAKIGLVLASRRPERVRRLVAAGVGSNIFAAEPAGPALSAVLRNGITPGTGARIRRSAVYALQSGGDPDAMAACLTRHWQAPTPHELARIESSVLLVAGDEDDVVGSVDELAACLPKAKVCRLRGIDHLATPYATELHDLTLEFLACDK
jgi:pimeloyl-ACP methyl ester carboxylesterase